MERIVCLLLGYLCGNFLTAEVVVKRAIGKRPQEIGSGNPGMANVMQEVGRKEGLLVLAGDIGKTIVACMVAYILFHLELGRNSILYAGIGTLLGHNYPVWNQFHGGKGVAVTCTFSILFAPLWGVISCSMGAAAVLVSGYLPIGGILIPFLFWLGIAGRTTWETGGLALVSLGCMVIKHYKGVTRVWNGEEKQVLKCFGKKK